MLISLAFVYGSGVCISMLTVLVYLSFGVLSEGTKGPLGKGPFGKGPKTMWLKTQRNVSHADFLFTPFA